MIGAMNRLAQGEHQVAIPALRRRDEIGEMAAALVVFRETAVDRERQQLELVKAKEAAEAAERQVRHLAHHDSLTGLANRVTFKRRLNEALATARRRGEGFAVLFLDLDHFKEINDTMGHLAGDAVLCQVSERLRHQVREVDTLARMGGDEFAIIQVETHEPQDVAVLCERLIAAVEREIEVDGAEAMVGLSIGVALFPDDAPDADQLLAKADLALYRAKGQGRGTYCFFQPEMAATLEQRKLLERDLRQALDKGEFALEYQPQIRIADRRLVGVEALLRWHHPKRGRVPPDRFIPLAEDTGLIQPIGTWVLEQAAADAAEWHAATARDLRVAVNLSPVQFRQRQLFQIVCEALRKSNLDPERLKLEITERLLMQASDVVCETLRKLKDLGVRVSMDDFGTGYSSMSSLRRFPFDEIKIDRSFIADLAKDPQAVAIVRATVALSDSLGMLTVAEGIETVKQLEFLRAEGCHVGQGFLFARPMPASGVVRLLSGIDQAKPLVGQRAAAFISAPGRYEIEAPSAVLGLQTPAVG
jgi:diguanylate cyclase (GGDEF)-like protein